MKRSLLQSKLSNSHLLFKLSNAACVHISEHTKGSLSLKQPVSRDVFVLYKAALSNTQLNKNDGLGLLR